MNENYLDKVCTKCNVAKARFEFNLSVKNKDGLFSYCRSCTKICYELNREKNHPPLKRDYPYP